MNIERIARPGALSAAFGALFFASGCVLISQYKADKDLIAANVARDAGRHADCVDLNSQAIEKYQALADGASPNNTYHWEGVRGVADSLKLRAFCRKELGQIDKAVADLDKSIKAYLQVSQLFRAANSWDPLKKMREETIADQTEVLARWKKELAHQEKKP